MSNVPLPFWSANTLLEALHISTHPFDLIQFVVHSDFLGWFQLASCSLLPVLSLTVIHRVLLEKSALCHDASLLKICCLCVALDLLGLGSEMSFMFLPTDYLQQTFYKQAESNFFFCLDKSVLSFLKFILPFTVGSVSSMNPLNTDIYMISQRYKSHCEVSHSSCTWINGYPLSDQKMCALRGTF